jgi:hypothetical protein
MIQPIETHYAGCRFRSRLEARWAVFFDHLAIRWEYEAQGYNLPSGARYLPDFRLPQLSALIEVKGDEEAFKADAPRYAEAVQTRSLPGRGLIFLGPVPDVIRRPIHLGIRPETHCCGETILLLVAIDFHWLAWEAQNPGEQDVLGLSTSRRSHNPCKLPEIGGLPYDGYISGGWYPTEWHVEPEVAAAYRAARSARFEHGEQPDRPDPEWPDPAKPGGGA